jgi:reductive dehalogenase
MSLFKKTKNKLSRREFVKFSGLAGAILSIGGAAGAGYFSGKSKESYTGWGKNAYGENQFFNRKPFRVNTPTYEKVGSTRRIQYLENIFKRNGELYRLMHPRDGSDPKWSIKQGLEELPEDLKTYYKNHPGSLEEFKKAYKAGKKQKKNWKKYKDKYLIASAWSAAHSSSMRGRDAFPAEPEGSPEKSDFKGITTEPYKLKSKAHGSKLMKQIAHSFGATLVGITEVKDDWVYQGYLRGTGKSQFKKPEHWKNAIVVAIPHEWDSLYANPTYGTSYDAYSMLNFFAGKLEVFLKHIGYSARSHVPPTDYDIAMPPLAIDAGLGEQGRHGILITPELGANTRLAAVTTDMPLKPDQPIDIGIKEFCEKCKICAEECPSGAISFEEKPPEVIRGYRRWKINQDKCFTVWNTVATSHPRGCRVCLAVCPYSRKNNWIHRAAKEIDPYDPTGTFSSAMLAMQKGFFDYPGAKEYLPPPDGSNATYGEAPDWLRTEEWFDID